MAFNNYSDNEAVRYRGQDLVSKIYVFGSDYHRSCPPEVATTWYSVSTL